MLTERSHFAQWDDSGVEPKVARRNALGCAFDYNRTRKNRHHSNRMSAISVLTIPMNSYYLPAHLTHLTFLTF